MTQFRRKPDGFVLLTTAISIVALIGMLGLAVDLGRMYIVKSEVQTFADLTSIAATRELDGTAAGVTRAKQVVASSQMKWNFATQPFTQVTVQFSSDRLTWNNGTEDVSHLKYVYVSSTVGVDLYFIPVVMPQQVPGVGFLAISFRANINGQSVVGQTPIEVFVPGGKGVLPFAPLAHNVNDIDFGFQIGDEITLRWPSSINSDKHFCAADNKNQWIQQSTIGGGDERGYIQENSAQAIREAIEEDRIYYTVTLGQPVTMTGGVKQSQAESLENRANQDLNTTSPSYNSYISKPNNSRRIGVVPIVNANDNFRVIGFAKVFLPMQQDKSGNKALCAEYAGHYYLEGSDEHGGPGPGAGVFQLRLLQ